VSGGRVDAVLELEDKAYVLEFKYKGGSKTVIQAVFAFLGRDDIEMRVL